MFPGFVTAYKDNKGYVHLYFFPGLDNRGKPIYRDIDLKHLNIKYDFKKNIDNSIDYKFYNKNIIKLHCKLLFNTTEEEFYQVIEV